MIGVLGERISVNLGRLGPDVDDVNARTRGDGERKFLRFHV